VSRHRRPVRTSAIGGALLLVLVICAVVAVSVAGLRPTGANAAEDPVRCTLTVPANPLSAQGLATPYQLSGHGCSETEKGHSAFVQATVIDTATGKVFNYAPLVITHGTRPAVAPVVPALPAHSVVGIWFGFNGDGLLLRGSNGSLRDGACVNGAAGSIFGQYAYCNAPAFFTAANSAISAGQLTVPELGTGSDGLPCPTTRDFGIVDQDQSDNVTSKYFAVGGRTAQGTTANAARLQRGVVLTNASDNGLIDNKIDPALGCSPWTAPDLGDAMQPSNSLALDELQAAARQAAPAALVPVSDPMVRANGGISRVKTDAYRAGVDMPPVSVDPGQSPAEYCRLMTTSGWQRMQADRDVFRATSSPDATAATTLYTFLGSRIAGSYDELNCGKLLKHANPFQVTMRGAVAVAVRMGAPAKHKVVAPHPVTTKKAPVLRNAAPAATPTAAPTKAPVVRKAVSPSPTPATSVPSPSPTTTKGGSGQQPNPTVTPSPTAKPTPSPAATPPAGKVPAPTAGAIPTPAPSIAG
jgi:hypothetical protein